jgi:hypothetical protein
MVELAEHPSEDDADGDNARALALVEPVLLCMLPGCEPGTEDGDADAADAAAGLLSLARPMSAGILRGIDSSAEEDLAIVSGT